jgi:phenylalanyl-tRNA synthetase beta chain
MKATLGWIREFVDVEMDGDELADRLTHVGLECAATLEGALDGIVVGEVLEMQPHPKADHLHLCKVSTGVEVKTVVCGAPNTRPGIKAPLAQVGARLPDGTEMRATEIRGVRSEGMLCSEAELLVGEDASGLWILPAELPAGGRVDELLALRDWVLAFELTPNRGDCLSVLGVAQEVAAIVGRKLRAPSVSLKEQGVPIGERFEVSILDPELCPRYVARMVNDVQVGGSPLWMRRRLQLVGLRPISNLVDVTNYVMWELGQPLHAFDCELLEGARIVVQRARQGETFVSLDGQERRLNDEMLMIWDGRRPVAVAGVMGGENSEVRPETRNVLIESAHFHPINIRRTAKTLGMATEASRRFERGIDPEGCPRAADRAAELMAQLAGGQVVPGSLDVHPGRKEQGPIPLRVSRANGLLGTDLDGTQMRSILDRLDMRVEGLGPDTFGVRPPTRRVDLTREVDLVEEVARVWGFDRIPCTLPRNPGVTGHGDEERPVESLVREVLVGFGFHEIITYSFIDEGSFDRLGLEPGDPLRQTLVLRNPIRQDQGAMRTTLLPGILDAVKRNLLHRNTDLRLFEVGRVFLPRGGDVLPDEPRRLGGALAGVRSGEHWGTHPDQADFFDLKGAMEGLFQALQFPEVEFVPDGLPVFLNPCCAARVRFDGQNLGWMGQVSVEVRDRWDLEALPFLFELDCEHLARLGGGARRFRPLPRFPEVVRDLSVLVEEHVASGSIVQAIRNAGLPWFEHVVLFDVFREEGKVPRGYRSLTFRIRYRSTEGSLTDGEVNTQHGRLMDHLRDRFDLRLRT